MVSGIRFRLLLLIGIIMRFIPSRRNRFYDLVIVRVDALGDYILFLNTLKAYKETYQGKRVLLICADLVLPLAKEDSFYTDIIDFNRKKFVTNLSYFWTVLKQLSKVAANKVVYPIPQRHIEGDIMVGAIKAPRKIGFMFSHSLLHNALNSFYTDLITNDPNVVSEIDFIENYTQKAVQSTFRYQLERMEMAKDFNSLRDLPSKYAVIAMSASTDDKVWPTKNFSEIIDKIPVDIGIVLSGAGAKDNKRAEQIMSFVSTPQRCINMVNKTSVKEMVSLIAHSQFVIGNDSSAVHIAAASHVPSICVFHGALFGRFLPYPDHIGYKKYQPRVVCYKIDCYGCNFKCKWPNSIPLPCLQNVTVDMVNRELTNMLDELSNDENNMHN